MERVPSSRMSELLQSWTGGNQDALEEIVQLAYPELHKIARGCLNNERPGHTIQATALVNEAYLKLADIHRMDWQDRAHFFAVGARIMRRILVDYARARGYAKRGGAGQRVELTDSLVVSPELEVDVELLDEALKALEKFDPRKAQVVEMRFFGGLTAEETAAVLHISIQSVHRDWGLARAWLLREMTQNANSGGA